MMNLKIASSLKNRIIFFFALVLTLVVLSSFRSDYFREYTDQGQSSLGSADMHNLAWASYSKPSVLSSLFLAKRIKTDGQVVDYAHYTNGYPLLIGTLYRIFGETVFTSRLYALLSVIVGGFLFLYVLVKRDQFNPLIYLSIPFLLISSIGRDAASFELLEPAHFLAIGITSLFCYRYGNLFLKLAAYFISIALYQVSFLFIWAIGIAWALKSKKWTDFFSCTIAICVLMTIVLVVFVGSSGLESLIAIIKQRSGFNIEGSGIVESIKLKEYINELLYKRINDSFNYLILFGAIAECVYAIFKRKFLLPCLFFCLPLYSIVFLNHTGIHTFTFLIYAFLIIVAWLSLIARCAKKLGSLLTSIFTINSRYIFFSIFFIYTVITLSIKDRVYSEVPLVKKEYYILKAWTLSNDPSVCSSFNAKNLNTDPRILSPFLSKYYGRLSDGKVCDIDFGN